MIEITSLPIEVHKIIGAAEHLTAGAVNVFIGTIRDSGKGKPVVKLEYEAYDSMAKLEIQKIIDTACTRWPIIAYAISHRTGVLLPGDVAVVAAISCPHRKESFEACQYIIDTLKLTVPIWKKEVFEDGEEWVSAHP